MGKHSRRKSGFVPKIAAGAAPVALLFAAPAAAFATPAGIALPVGSDHHDLRLGSTAVATNGEQRLTHGVAETRHTGVWLPGDADVLTENAERVDPGSGGFTGDLGVHRSSGQGVDLGGLGAIGATSAQHVTGRLGVGQEHELGGGLGPASGVLRTTQSAGSGAVNSISGTFDVDHVVHVENGVTTSVRGTLDQHQSVSASVLDQPVLDF